MAALLAAEQLDGRLDSRPRVISTSSELRTPEMAERIEEAWGSAPYDMYGITEAGIFAAECDWHRVHVLDDEFVFEVVDGDNRPVAHGDIGGKILLTNLWVRTQPLIRYVIDYRVAVSPERCPAADHFRSSRPSRAIPLPRGLGGEVAVHPRHFRSPLAAERGVRQYEVIRRCGEIEVRVVPAPGCDRAEMADRLVGAIRGRLNRAGAEAPPVRVEFVDALPRDSNRMGKLKLIRIEAG